MHKNKEEHNKYRREVWYPKHREKVKASVKRRKEAVREEYQAYKDRLGCEACDETDSCCLEFHHIDPKTKSFEVAQGPSDGYSFARIKEEIDKCVLLCANCHRKLHARVV